MYSNGQRHGHTERCFSGWSRCMNRAAGNENCTTKLGYSEKQEWPRWFAIVEAAGSSFPECASQGAAWTIRLSTVLASFMESEKTPASLWMIFTHCSVPRALFLWKERRILGGWRTLFPVLVFIFRCDTSAGGTSFSCLLNSCVTRSSRCRVGHPALDIALYRTPPNSSVCLQSLTSQVITS